MMAGVVRCRSNFFAVLAAAVALVVVAGCSGGGGKKSHAAAPTTTTVSGNAPIVLTLGSVGVDSYGPTVKMPSNEQKAALAAAQAYVDAAMTAPYNTGQLGAKYASLFNTGVRDSATKADVGVLTDERIGKVKYTATASPVAVSGLADATGKFVYLAGRFTVKAEIKTQDGPIGIRRDVELTFAPSGKSWTVIAYRAHVTRRSRSGATTTTSVASSGSTTP
jgi:hypothetical protein